MVVGLCKSHEMGVRTLGYHVSQGVVLCEVSISSHPRPVAGTLDDSCDLWCCTFPMVYLSHNLTGLITYTYGTTSHYETFLYRVTRFYII